MKRPLSVYALNANRCGLLEPVKKFKHRGPQEPPVGQAATARRQQWLLGARGSIPGRTKLACSFSPPSRDLSALGEEEAQQESSSRVFALQADLVAQGLCV